MLEEADRLTRLVDSLLFLSRADSASHATKRSRYSHPSSLEKSLDIYWSSLKTEINRSSSMRERQ